MFGRFGFGFPGRGFFPGPFFGGIAPSYYPYLAANGWGGCGYGCGGPFFGGFPYGGGFGFSPFVPGFRW
jgi:hypothetical protein